MHILLVEDDRELSTRLTRSLSEAGFAVDIAYGGLSAAEMGEAQSFDAVVLDLGLPEMSGLEVLRRWRRAGINTPVLVLTARDAWPERVEGLNAGADDYLGKPFQTMEVVARLRALARRANGTGATLLRHGPLELDPSSATVTIDGRCIELTARELGVLRYLMLRTTRIVSQRELIDHIYAMDDQRESNTIEVYVARLRRKLGRETIRTIRGLGYRMG